MMSVGAMEDGGRESCDAKSLEPDLTRKTFTFWSVCVCLCACVGQCIYVCIHGHQYMCVHAPCGLGACSGP